MKVLYNRCFGGFSLSRIASKALVELGIDIDPKYGYLPDGISRHDPRLIAVVECLGLKASSGRSADLMIYKVDGDCYRIEEYDGAENVIEPSDYVWIKS